ncbi:hypothetical protein Adt_24524 [Abeliophyllum distichum]|uniref:RNase H type-1 domain-containing protein n=1 Tax=Abeliophyllum distichum TaxID=126358 RepID=A0ABD1SFK9_9LAMI
MAVSSLGTYDLGCIQHDLEFIIPTTVSFFYWRLWQGLIPVDVVIQRRIGSHIASRLGSYKINNDGYAKDGFASGWRIIRDSSGQCIRAFFSSYDECSILEAELRAILDEVGDLGLFRPLFATSDISLPSTVILFLIFITKAIKWLTYLLQWVGIVVAILSTAPRTYRNVTAA